jgi:hypothetical protein
MVQLRMESQMARIGIESRAACLELRTIPARLEMETIPAQLNLHSPRPQLHIDQSRCRASQGYKNNDFFIQDTVSFSRGQAAAGIGRRAYEGDYMAEIEKGNRLEDLALDAPASEAGSSAAGTPTEPPEMYFDVLPLEANYQPGDVEINFTPARVEPTYLPGQVDIYVRQKNYLNIDWVGQNYDRVA